MQRAFEFSISDGEQRIKPTDYINKLIGEGWVVQQVIFSEPGRVFLFGEKKKVSLQRAFEFSISDGEQRIKPTDYINKLIGEGWIIQQVIFSAPGRVFVLATKKQVRSKQKKESI